MIGEKREKRKGKKEGTPVVSLLVYTRQPRYDTCRPPCTWSSKPHRSCSLLHASSYLRETGKGKERKGKERKGKERKGKE